MTLWDVAFLARPRDIASIARLALLEWPVAATVGEHLIIFKVNATGGSI